MLRSFRLGNHRSFATEQELLLMPSLPGDHRSTLPVTAIYGANGSGKSALLNGLAFMFQAVTSSFSNWDVEGAVPRTPFRLNPEVRAQPSIFVVEVIIDSVPYTYGFAVDDERVVEEWLYSYPAKRKRVVFERELDNIRFGSTIHNQRSTLDVLRSLVRPNALFISLAARLKMDTLMPVHQWFSSEISMHLGARMPDQILVESVGEMLARHDDSSARFVQLLNVADVGISDVLLESKNLTANQGYNLPSGMLGFATVSHVSGTKRPMRRALKFTHRGSPEMLDLADESAGTRAWIELLPIVLDVLDRGRVLLVDEIDSSLHPLLTARLVGLFQDRETNPRGAQIIFTTHDTSLLGSMLGEEVLRRDQVWFVEKDNSGASSLYPLTDFKPRKEHNTERRYLGGSFGAVPVLDALDFAEAVRPE